MKRGVSAYRGLPFFLSVRLGGASSATNQIDLGTLLSNRAHASNDAEWNRFSFRTARMEPYRSRHIFDCVPRGNLEQRMVRLDALDSSELIRRFAETRIAVLTHDNYLEVRRGPHLGNNFDGLRVSNLSRGNRSRDSLALDSNTLHHLRAQ